MPWIFFLFLDIFARLTAWWVVIPFALLQRIPWWMNTPDDTDLEHQGLYEPQVLWWFAHFGQRVKTWYWLGWRNQYYGLFWHLSAQAPKDTTRIYSSPLYPSPGKPGFCHVRMTVGGRTFHEWNWIANYPGGKHCIQIRVGWKLAEMDLPGPIAYCFQFKPYLTVPQTP